MPSGVYLRTKKCNSLGRPKGYTVSQQTRERIKASLMGVKHSEERRLAISMAKRGKPAWNKGLGEKTKLSQMVRSSAQYFDWRRRVFYRDSFTCTLCNRKGGWNKEEKTRVILNVDHMKAFSLIMKDNNITDLSIAFSCKELWDINNGRTLCFNCHKETPNFGTKAKLSPPLV